MNPLTLQQHRSSWRHQRLLSHSQVGHSCTKTQKVSIHEGRRMCEIQFQEYEDDKNLEIISVLPDINSKQRYKASGGLQGVLNVEGL